MHLYIRLLKAKKASPGPSTMKNNKQIGAEIKRIRQDRRISQMELAEEVGVSFQQIQKYERGINRISVERIQRIAKALGISVNTFFEKEKGFMVAEPPAEYLSKKTAMAVSQEEAKLIGLFRKIGNKKIKEGLFRQIRGLAELSGKK